MTNLQGKETCSQTTHHLLKRLEISDHDIVITDSMIKPHYCKQQPQKRYIFAKANWEKIKTDITEIAKDINNNINSKDINYSWNQLKHGNSNRRPECTIKKD
jgi:hypothetical protein